MAIINAASANQSDVAAAISSASPGDTVQVPTGTVTWSTGVTISQSLNLIGAGSGSTVISRTSGSGFTMVAINLSADVPARVSGFTFNNVTALPGKDTPAISLANTSSNNLATFLTNVRIDNCVFNYGQSQIMVFAAAYPCVDHCTFYNPDMGLQISCDDDAAWQRPIAPGTKNSVFIEDCTFTLDNNITAYPPDSFCVLHTHGGRSVIRHCTMNSSAYTIDSNVLFIDCHGNQHYWDGLVSDDFRGTVMTEVYNNTIHTNKGYRLLDLRAGSHFIHDNQYTCDTGSAPPMATMRDEEDNSSSNKFPTYRWPASGGTPPNGYVSCSWPCEDQINNTFFWNNSWVGGVTGSRLQQDTDFGTWNPNDPYFIQQNRDYWTKAPDSSTVTNYSQPTVPPSLSNYPTVYKSVTAYASYTYPHPLTLLRPSLVPFNLTVH